ncbi:Tetratricopeptide repeat-containing protein [Chitinophaga sp. CF118]|uniref:tetratricopeptide repeat protein n=1 Tax=Chitinophaga sp. CF118 TaxID=1884367 RepID=UPI0008EC8FB8|nr:tetratricopeptide repeat protein [Chitinophaga sp. CF118]SFD49136.1 Tetratricopeptide repeat-containing protein [Chitinophaga sp. CF118]
MSFFKRLFSPTDSNDSDNSICFSEGDIFYTQFEDKCHIYKLLVEDAETYHVLTYVELDKLPNIPDLDNLPVLIHHSPFDRKAFENAVLLANRPVNSIDLIGYHEYLRQTQSPNYYVQIANDYYQSGLRLTDEKLYKDAIDVYSKAIDLFPQFFEAIDNRAFCKMDRGLWNEAIEDFKLSLQVNPNSLLAEFSIGECYFNMSDYQNAKLQFEKAHQIDPNHPAPLHFLNRVNEIIKG